jgi:hypothetical protein
MDLSSLFPPTKPNVWRTLDNEGRVLWLLAARDRFFDKSKPFQLSKVPGRVVILEGALIDNLLGFFCAMGEAVNGPGGYFGLHMVAFDDCLFSGFGLEYPYTIVWKNSAQSSHVLNSTALISYLDDTNKDLDPDMFTEEGLAWLTETRAAAVLGTRSLFDEIVETIRSVPVRNGGMGDATLLLE